MLDQRPAGHLVRKYGHVIGVTTEPVAAGEHVHTHNLAMPDDPQSVAAGGSPGATRADAVPALPAGNGICSDFARGLSPWVRWTPGVPRPLGLFEEASAE